MVYGRYNYSIHGVYKPTFTSLGGHHLVEKSDGRVLLSGPISPRYYGFFKSSNIEFGNQLYIKSSIKLV